ncbi:hypothetical protein T492DRAFT_871279 [Pavlovales sp. CCMP2436]|nr:hypothetical protein T492DRAFT_871279 [Pavlovales sp. CCMP2436]
MRRSAAHHALFEQMLADSRICKIVLKRENRLIVCTSMLRASTTRAYTHKTYDQVCVTIRPADLQRFNESYDDYYAWLDENLVGQAVHRVSYEMLSAAPEDSVAAACAFLGVGASVPRFKCFTRQSTSPLRDALVNFEKLREAFAGTERAGDVE